MHLCQSANKDGSLLRDVRKTGQFTHVSSIFGHVVRGKRFITHGRRNPRYKYLGRGIFQFADSVLSLPVK